jgi:hypothetical protein
MAIRDLVRGSVEWPRLEALAVELCYRYDREAIRVEFLEADNWLSTPFVVDDDLFVKAVTPQNSLVHGLFTAGRNLGAFSTGTPGFFEHVEGPATMVQRELEATERMRAAGLNAPEPLEAFAFEDLGVLVLEFLPSFRTFEELDDREVSRYAPALFDLLARLHDNDLAHGDLRAENVLLSDGDIYFVDATTVRAEGMDSARAYDLACAMGTLCPRIGPTETVAVAREQYDAETLLAAREFLDFVALRPDHAFDANRLKGEIEKETTAT